MPHDFVYRKRGWIEDDGEYVIYEVDREKSTYFGTPWNDLGAYGKRKFENLLIIQNPRDRIIFRYV
jgi:hypothetical protein